MKRKYAFVRTELQRAFVVHANSRQSRRRVESIALIGPPAVNAHVIESLMNRPVATYLPVRRPPVIWRSTARQRRGCAWVTHPASESPSFNDGVQHSFESLSVQIVDHLLRIREILWMKCELSVVSVPARRCEVGAQIDQCVARQFLFPKGPRDPFDLFGAAQRAVRLQIAERPERRQLGLAG